MSKDLDFGKRWLQYSCSEKYFDSIRPVFSYLEALREKDKNAKWKTITDKSTKIYLPILNAFKDELERLNNENLLTVPQRLVKYLVGDKDFYKVIKGKNKVEIQAFNMYGSLNQSINKIKPKASISKLKLPDRLIEVIFKKNSKTTLLVTLNEGWQFSSRIHSAKSTIETSLKFDINLVSSPHSLFTNHLFIGK